MRKIIATTTINAPTEAIRKYDAMEDWELIVVGDRKTPKYKLERGTFLPWEYTFGKYPELARLIGFNSVRLGRMVAFIEAYKRGADILASIDDDCMPMENWGKNVRLGEEVEAWEWNRYGIAFDPIGCYPQHPSHRGFPIELLDERAILGRSEAPIVPFVQEDLCLGESDIDAYQRLSGSVVVMGTEDDKPFFADCFSPINTQNTFIHRSVIKDFYANIPFIGRADDIWAGYLFQALHPRSTIYCAPTAIHNQERSIQSLVNDLEDEIFLYRNTYQFLLTLKNEGHDAAIKKHLPEKAQEAIKLYRSYFND